LGSTPFAKDDELRDETDGDEVGDDAGDDPEVEEGVRGRAEVDDNPACFDDLEVLAHQTKRPRPNTRAAITTVSVTSKRRCM